MAPRHRSACSSRAGLDAPTSRGCGGCTLSPASKTSARRRSRPTARRSSAGCAVSDDPAAIEQAAGPLAVRSDPCSDPCCAHRRTIVVPGGESVRLVFSTGVAADSRSRGAPDREVLRRPQRPARHRPRVDRRPTRAARPGDQPAGGGRARAARVPARAHRPVLAAQGQDAGRERAADVGPVVDRHLGRPAHPARARRGPRARAARSAGAARPPVLAPQGARRRPGHPQHAPDRATPTTSTTACACSSAPATPCSCSTSPAASSFAEQTRCTPTS